LRFLIEARPGAGKTTAALRLVHLLRERGIQVSGITTQEIREGGKRLGFAIEAVSSKENGVLAHIDFPGPPRVGRYGVDVAALEDVSIPELERDSDAVVIDELGSMELASAAFVDAVAAVFDGDVPVVATVHAKNQAFTDGLKRRDDVELIRLTKGNRDVIPEQIARRFF
jgi:nucleoside-triphosphatase